MRVVEYQKPTNSLAYRALWGLAVVSGLFSLVICAYMTANNLRLKSADPIHTPALQRMIKDLKATPQDEALKEQIREMDYLARRAFFTSQEFNKLSIWLLAGGLVVMVVSFKSVCGYHRQLPFPDSRDPRDDLAANALWARKAVTVAALVVFGLALSLALPWRSTLDHVPPPAATASAKPGSATSPVTPAPAGTTKPAPVTAATPAPALAPAPASATRSRFASREERSRTWPSFRGPASGHTAATLPTEWDGKSGKGIAWKAPLPLPGFGSPILWGDRIFLSGANTQERAVYCVDAREGKVLWTKPVGGGASPGEAPRVLGDTGYAAPTMATDGYRVFALFATGDLAAFDLDGTPLWTRSLGLPDNPYGQGSSLEVFEDAVLVQYDQKKNAFLGAFDTATGTPRWRVPRDVGASWASPSVVDVGGQPRLVLVADAFLTLHDPRDGKELWRVQWGRAGDVATSPVFANGLFYAACDHVKLAAVDAESHKVAWENTTEIPGVSTPVAAGAFLFGGQSEGGIVCWEARTGKKLWLQETDEGFYASPLVAGNRVYLLERSGKMFVFEVDGAAYKPVAQPVLGEEASATPAVYGNSLILRGAKTLFRIGS